MIGAGTNVAGQQLKGENELLHAELQCDSQVHRNGLAVERCRLILPLVERVFRGLMQERRAGNDFHRSDLPADVNQRVSDYIARDVLTLGHGRIERSNLADQPCGFDISTDGKRRFRRGRLFGSAFGEA